MYKIINPNVMFAYSECCQLLVAPKIKPDCSRMWKWNHKGLFRPWEKQQVSLQHQFFFPWKRCITFASQSSIGPSLTCFLFFFLLKRGAKLCVGKVKRKVASKEMPLKDQIITRKFVVYFFLFIKHWRQAKNKQSNQSFNSLHSMYENPLVRTFCRFILKQKRFGGLTRKSCKRGCYLAAEQPCYCFACHTLAL